MASPKTKRILKTLGIKQDKPKELVGHEDATKPFRYKPGDSRLKNNKGAQLQIIPPRAQANERKRMNELIKDFQHIPLAKELATALGIEGEATLVEAVTMGLYLAAIRGDINATKLIQAVTEHKDFTTTTPPAIRIKIVDPKNQQLNLPAPEAEVAPGEEQPAEEQPPFADTKEN
jgi:hypothetical protein